MKKIVFIFLMIANLIVAKSFAQVSFRQALDDFHNTLAFTYHPMADDSNFAPIHKRSAELATGAEAIEKALDGLPEKKAVLENAVEQLAEQCKALDDVIQKGAPDEIIRTRLTAIHSKFHEIDEMFSKEEKK